MLLSKGTHPDKITGKHEQQKRHWKDGLWVKVRDPFRDLAVLGLAWKGLPSNLRSRGRA